MLNRYRRLACLDVETTGARPTHDRVTEIGIVLVDDGEIVEQWSTLVNPQASIPEYIQVLTGITNEMVADAPAFEQVAPAIAARLAGRVMVAHNARFDHGFLRNEFRRLGQRFNPVSVCTVKLSRSLYAEHARHNLDALMQRHGLDCTARHRALGDARVLHDLLRAFVAQKGADAVQGALDAQQQRVSMPPHLDASLLDAIPDRPGVYLFYGDKDVPLYVGKSVGLRSRVMAHFSGDHQNNKDTQLSLQVRRIEWIETAGELGALLKEVELIKTMAPLCNRRLRQTRGAVGFYWDAAEEPLPRLVEIGQLELADTRHLYGLFRSVRQGQSALRALAQAHQVCLKVIGLEQGTGACFGWQLKRCRGACTGQESALQHRVRLREALEPLRLQTWPYDGPVGVRETGADSERADIHVVDQWCYLGVVNDAAELEAITRHASARFDMDTYRILSKFIGGRRRGLDVIGVPRVPTRQERPAIFL